MLYDCQDLKRGASESLLRHLAFIILRVDVWISAIYLFKQTEISVSSNKQKYYFFFLDIHFSEIDVWVPEPDHSEVPAEWWDTEADKSLLIGVFKHGK